MTIIEALRDARAKQDINHLIGTIPYAGFLGITATTDADNQVLAQLDFRQTNIGNPALPAIHGGVVGAFLETTAILQLMWLRESISIPKTITITVDYLRSAGPEVTFAKAEVTKLGMRVANVRAFAWQNDPEKPVAGLNANFLVKPAA